MKTRATTAVLPANAAPRFREASVETADRVSPPSFLARQVLKRLSELHTGLLRLEEGGRRHEFGRADASLPEPTLHVHDERFWRAIALRGSIGAGEAYARGWWTTDDAPGVVRLFVRNRDVLGSVDGGWSRLTKPLHSAFHVLRKNTKSGSRENIAAHYDLSNEFFALFLDETMTYSCGIFEDQGTTLRAASEAKIDRLCRKLDLEQSDHLLEIGTGWGAFALHAAREFGCRVTTTTISEEQHAEAERRVRAAGLEGRITLRRQDYRDLEGSFDKLVSVEMIEAVGHQYYEDFFRVCAERLRPGGRMALQAITIADQYYESAKRSVDFIKRYIFPGSCIPSVTALLGAATAASDLRLVHLEDIGPDYVPTLAAWRANLLERADDARALGFDDVFLRLWDWYFSYCEGGFAERQLGDAQMILERPECRDTPLLGVL